MCGNVLRCNFFMSQKILSEKLGVGNGGEAKIFLSGRHLRRIRGWENEVRRRRQLSQKRSQLIVSSPSPPTFFGRSLLFFRLLIRFLHRRTAEVHFIFFSRPRPTNDLPFPLSLSFAYPTCVFSLFFRGGKFGKNYLAL